MLAGACRGAWGAPQEAEGVSGAEPAHCVHAPGGVQGATRGALHSIDARCDAMNEEALRIAAGTSRDAVIEDATGIAAVLFRAVCIAAVTAWWAVTATACFASCCSQR
jgi:hypothetical protein